MLGCPLGGIANVLDTDFRGVRVPQPQERAAVDRLIRRRVRPCCARSSTGSTTATPAHRGSSTSPDRPGRRPRRSAPRPTRRRRARARRCTGIRAGLRRTGTRSRGRDRRVVRSSVIPASSKCHGRPRVRPARARPRPASRRRARCPRPGIAGHQASRPETAPRVPAATASGARSGASSSSARPLSPSPWRGGRSRSSSKAAPRRPSRNALPRRRAQRCTGRPRFDGGEQPELGDEGLVVGGQLPVDPARERVARELAFEQPRRLPPPAALSGKPRKRTARDELSRGLGDDVVVRRRAAAGERGQILLVPADLADREVVALEQVRDRRASPRAVAGSRPRDQPDARPRSRSSSAPRTETGSPATTIAGAQQRAPRNASRVRNQAAASTVRCW